MWAQQDSSCSGNSGYATQVHQHGRGEQWVRTSISTTKMGFWNQWQFKPYQGSSESPKKIEAWLGLFSTWFLNATRDIGLVGSERPSSLFLDQMADLSAALTWKEQAESTDLTASFQTRSIIILFSNERIKLPNQVLSPHGPVQATEKDPAHASQGANLPRLVFLYKLYMKYFTDFRS